MSWSPVAMTARLAFSCSVQLVLIDDRLGSASIDDSRARHRALIVAPATAAWAGPG